MSSAASEPATTFRPYHFPPAPAADQPLFQSSAVASIQLPRTSAAPAATQRPLYFPAGTQAPIRFSAVAPRAAATHRHAQMTVDPPASATPQDHNNFHRSSLASVVGQGRQALLANPPAPAGFEPQQPSFASLPASIQPQVPEEVYFGPGPDPVPAPRCTSGDLVNRRSGGGVDFRIAHDNAIARRECHEQRLFRDLAAIYRAHIPHPQSTYSDNRNPFVPPAPPLLSLSPRATYYLFTQIPAYATNAAPQPQYQTRPTNPLPFYSYWGRDLNVGPGLPTMRLSGEPALRCFKRHKDGNQTDWGFGPGVSAADPFRWVCGQYERDHRRVVVMGDRAMLGIGETA